MFAKSLASSALKVCPPFGSQVARRLRVPTMAVRCMSGSGSVESKHPQYQEGQHRSNAQKLVNDVPVITVDARVAVCDGGSGALGHPVEYIQLDTVSNEPQACKYCGLRFVMGEVHLH